MPTPASMSFLGAVKGSTRAKVSEVLARVAGAMGVLHVWGYDPNAGNPEHHAGTAADFMLYTKDGKIDTALGWRIRAYLWANRKRLGVRHIIYRRSIISTVVQPGVNRPMADRGNATDNHMDHVHVQFFDTAYQRPPAVSPKPAYPGHLIRRGARGAVVTFIQRRVGTAADGKFGPNTEAAVKVFQGKHGLDKDGVVGRLTWAKL
jgi:peptidoglycan hydrolase-like protein with peptidoglycan-binding domain